MIINIEKSMLAHNEFPGELVQKSREILAYPTKLMGEGFKYLGFSSSQIVMLLKTRCGSFKR